MTSEACSPEEMLNRIRILEQENEMLAERAEEISLLGMVAEQIGSEEDTLELLTGVLERVCILKGIPYGACLEASEHVYHPLAAYHFRRPELAPPDQFSVRPGTPAPGVEVLDSIEVGARFDTFSIVGAQLQPAAVAMVPFRGGGIAEGLFLFADDTRSKGELAPILPLLRRVVELTTARLDNVRLVNELQRVNRNLDQLVEQRTGELLRSEERYRTLFDHVPDGVLLVSADEENGYGRIVDANKVASTMHGYTLEELRGLNLEQLNAPGPAPQLESFEARIWRLRPGETVQEQLFHRRKDGSTFPVEAIGTLVELRGRQYMLGFSRDITQRRAAEEALLKSQRTESVGLLAGGIAHDFNNLLTAIMGQTFIAMEKLEGPEDGRANLERALHAAEKASILTQQMLAYSGRGKFTIQPIAINRMIRENQRFLEAAIPKNVRFDLDLAEDVPPVTGDLGQLQQVIMNLVINGSEAIGPGGGCIRIRTSLVQFGEPDSRLWSRGGNHLPAGDYVLLEVADDGCGMDPETRSRVFDPFFTTKEKGHGLGLAAVQGIVRSHRGGLQMESELGRGTQFRIAFPAGEHCAAGPVEPPPLDGPHHGGRRVLVIDDEDYMLEVVRDILTVNGHTALLAESGEAGIDILRRDPGGVDVVLLDLTMPGLSGQETFKILRELDPAVRVILTSGFAEEEATARLREMRLDGFLQKPYPAKELIRLLESLPERS